MNQKQRKQHLREVTAHQEKKRSWAKEHPAETAAVKKFRAAERNVRVARVTAQEAARVERKKLKAAERLKRKAEQLKGLIDKAKIIAPKEPGRIIMPPAPRIVTSGRARPAKLVHYED